MWRTYVETYVETYVVIVAQWAAGLAMAVATETLGAIYASRTVNRGGGKQWADEICGRS